MLYIALHLAAVMALLTSALPTLAFALITVLLGVHAVERVRVASLHADKAIVSVEIDETGTLLELNNGRRIPVTITEIYCTSWLLLVGFRRKRRQPRAQYWLAVLPDCASPDIRRQLRACLLDLRLKRSTD